MRRAARTDATHSAIRKALRDSGFYVRDMSRVGEGWPDLFLAKGGTVLLAEVKDGSLPPSHRRLTSAQADLHVTLARAGVQVVILTSVEDVKQL